MLVVQHSVQPSPIHGLGVFSCETIQKGDLVWRFDARIDLVLSVKDLSGLPASTINHILRHAEFLEDRQVFILGSDGDSYMNHSDEPSLLDNGSVMVASRTLCAGDELTCDYRIVRVLAYHPDMSRMVSAPSVLASIRTTRLTHESGHVAPPMQARLMANG